jgi:ATP-dependent exoDNAse (exonuclease V) alpha subunit
MRDALDAAGRRVDGIQAAIDRARNRYETWSLRPGQLVIVDEAGMADTPTLSALTVHVRAAGAKLLLVGNPEQLPAVGADGLFRTLVDRRSDTPELVDVQRSATPTAPCARGRRRRRWRYAGATSRPSPTTRRTAG